MIVGRRVASSSRILCAGRRGITRSWLLLSKKSAGVVDRRVGDDLYYDKVSTKESMVVSVRRRTFQIGRSRGVTLPGTMKIGEEVSMAAKGDRLLLLDTAGEIPESKLSEFLERFDAMFWTWWESQKGADAVASEKQAGGLVSALEVVVIPESPVYGAHCPRCLYHFPWDFEQGAAGFCPRCGARLSFRV